MKSEKILNSIPKLQQLDENSLDLISNVINSCLVVQAMQQAQKNPVLVQKLITSLQS